MTLTVEERAKVLVEALPYIKRFYGQTVVIKVGGNAIESARDETLLDVVLLRYVGMQPVLVHGGGPEISAMSERLGLKPTFKKGLRVTDEKTMEVVKMVLTGKVGPDLVAAIHRLGGQAVGMSGEDGPTIIAEPLDHSMGYVGKVTQVNKEPITALVGRGYIPVIASIGLGYDGHAYNINADTVAAEIAVALNAAKVILLTDVPGVLGVDNQVVAVLSREDARQRIEAGEVTGGMIPKLEACLRALDVVPLAHIVDGRTPHALLLELFTEGGHRDDGHALIAMTTSELADRYLMQTGRRLPVTFVRGQGCLVYDDAGREYLDLVAGIAVNLLGHAHPQVVAAVTAQASTLIHTSNLYFTQPQVELAQRLVELSFPSRVFFCNSGAEANEAAIKLARKWGTRNREGAFEIIATAGSFHGRTLATITAGGQPKYSDPFKPLPEGFCTCPTTTLKRSRRRPPRTPSQ